MVPTLLQICLMALAREKWDPNRTDLVGFALNDLNFHDTYINREPWAYIRQIEFPKKWQFKRASGTVKWTLAINEHGVTLDYE